MREYQSVDRDHWEPSGRLATKEGLKIIMMIAEMRVRVSRISP